MSATIQQLVEVINEVLQSNGSTLGTSIPELRKVAVAVVAERRRVEPNTIADKFIRGLAPDVTSSAQFDRLLEDFIRNRSDRLLDVLAAHAGPEDDQLLQSLRVRKSPTVRRSRPATTSVIPKGAGPASREAAARTGHATGSSTTGGELRSPFESEAPTSLPIPAIADLVAEFAIAIKTIDDLRPLGRAARFRPGVGPLTETELTTHLIDALSAKGAPFSGCGAQTYPGSRYTCDLVLPNQWSIEIKLARPFGDNGKPAERWAENLLYPYPGNMSLLGDCMKLLKSKFTGKLGVIIVGYEHMPPVIPLEPAVRGFEVLASHVVGVRLGPRATAFADDLVHPVHQRAVIFGWEVIRPAAGV